MEATVSLSRTGNGFVDTLNNAGARLSAAVYSYTAPVMTWFGRKRTSITRMFMAMYCLMLSMMTFSMVGYADDDEVVDKISTKLVETIGKMFNAVKTIAVPLCALGLIVCLVAIAFSVFTGNTRNVGIWKNSMIVIAVVLVFVFLVPTLIEWAGKFGKDINDNQTLEGVQGELNS